MMAYQLRIHITFAEKGPRSGSQNPHIKRITVASNSRTRGSNRLSGLHDYLHIVVHINSHWYKNTHRNKNSFLECTVLEHNWLN